MWTLEEGISLARLVQSVVVKEPMPAHVALGGSVLMNGKSTKDLDLYIYPHNTGYKPYVENVIMSLERVGFKNASQRPHQSYKDEKIVWAFDYLGRRVDVFFLMLENAPVSEFTIPDP